MAATLTEIREALAANLSAVFGTSVYVTPYMDPNPTTPRLQVVPDTINYDQAGVRGLDRWMLIVQGFAGTLELQGSQLTLDAWLAPSGSQSVKAGIEADRTLGGKVMDCWVQSVTGYREYSFGAGTNMTKLLGCDWHVAVLNSGA